MLIRVSEDQERLLLEWITPFTAAEFEDGIEPSGYELRIDICPPYGAAATAVKGSHSLEIGDVEVEFSS